MACRMVTRSRVQAVIVTLASRQCLNEEVFASLAETRAMIECWRRDYN